MFININGAGIRLPDFFIVGAAKSATTSLYYYLKAHPQIFLPEVKEPSFFSFANNPPNFVSPGKMRTIVWKLENYSALFKGADEGQIMGDISPSHLYTYESTISNIKNFYGANYKKLKIIIILRNPVDRAWSQFMHFKKHLNEPLSFAQAINSQTIKYRLENNWSIFYDYVGAGMYYNQVKAYLSEFPFVKIFLFDELKREATKTIHEIFSFINVQSDFNPQNLSTIYNRSGIPKIRYFYPLYKMIVKDNFIKCVLRLIIPIPKAKRKKLRINIQNAIFERVLVRETIESEMEKELYSIYHKNIIKLTTLLKGKESLLLNWIKDM